MRLHVSSSISNFKEKLEKRYADYELWSLAALWESALFVGMYHIGDYLRFAIHRGPKTIFWAGSDILNVNWMNFMVFGATHYCENEVEQAALYERGIIAEVHPMIFDDMSTYEVCYKQSNAPYVFLCAHKGREKEYGVDTVERIAQYVPEVTFVIYGISGTSENPNVFYRGRVSEEDFEREISYYQGVLRLNSFDGFGECVAKAILMGQYPITSIKYPHIAQETGDESLLAFLRMLKCKSKPNPSSEYWRKQLCKRIEAPLS